VDMITREIAYRLARRNVPRVDREFGKSATGKSVLNYFLKAVASQQSEFGECKPCGGTKLRTVPSELFVYKQFPLKSSNSTAKIPESLANNRK